MATNADARDFTSKSPTISRLNRPTRELVLAAHRERGLLLRAMIADLIHEVRLAFARSVSRSRHLGSPALK